MRSLFLCLIFLFVTTDSFAWQGPQVMFDNANSLLKEGNYPEALNAYRKIENSGQVSGALYLNMGIAALQIDSLGLSKYYFLKASDFTTTQESANSALEYVESQFSRQSAMLPQLPWDKAIESIKDGPGAFGVFMLGFFLILISVLVIILHWFNVITLKKQATIISIATITSILVVFLAFYVDYIDQRYHKGVIISNEIQVTNQAAENADLVSLAYEGYTITVDKFMSEKADGWYYIRLGNGQYGWIQLEGAKIL